VDDPLVLDTHTLVGLVEGESRLGRKSRELAQAALQSDVLAVSAICFWEIAMLVKSGRLGLAMPTSEWHRGSLNLGILEAPVTGQIGLLAEESAGLPGDSADRIITATAIVLNATLLTADQRILNWPVNLTRFYARD
jgi:PIN domain nuclease of toxin-antitoxin system